MEIQMQSYRPFGKTRRRREEMRILALSTDGPIVSRTVCCEDKKGREYFPAVNGPPFFFFCSSMTTVGGQSWPW